MKGAKHSAQIADEVKESAVDSYMNGLVDLEGAQKIMRKFGICISAVSIRYAMNRFGTWYCQPCGRGSGIC